MKKNIFEWAFHLIFWVFVIWSSSFVSFNVIRLCKEVVRDLKKIERITHRENQGQSENIEGYLPPKLEVHPDLLFFQSIQIKSCKVITFFDGQVLLPILLGNVFKIILFYGIALWWMPYFLKKRRIWLFVMYLTAWIGAVAILELGLDYLYLSNAKAMIYPDGFRPNNWVEVQEIQLKIYPWIIFWAFMYRFGSDWLRNERIKEQIQQEKLHTELQFLKSQINPHFLFNVLNNLYGLALTQKADKTADGIAQLAKQMRYMLYESEVEWIALDREIAHIATFIDLQKLRFSKQDQVKIDFEVNGETDRCMIAPMLLIPFVENAFKHGLSLIQPTYIDIRLTVHKHEIIFEVLNSIHQNQILHDSPSTNLGLMNVRRRLDLIYGKHYELEISPNDYIFKVYLKLSYLASMKV
jgi:two-component system, LytTR family, sensor kinase